MPFEQIFHVLIWNYHEREKAFWYKTLHSSPTRIPDTERIRPTAETDFCLIDYIDIKVNEEEHKLIRSEMYEEKQCRIIESIPISRDLAYGKRISWIEETEWIPQKVEYYDKQGALWKTVVIEWQQKFGLWFWKSALVENAQTDSKTTISIDDVRINVGLDERDFTMHGLEQKKHGF